MDSRRHRPHAVGRHSTERQRPDFALSSKSKKNETKMFFLIFLKKTKQLPNFLPSQNNYNIFSVAVQYDPSSVRYTSMTPLVTQVPTTMVQSLNNSFQIAFLANFSVGFDLYVNRAVASTTISSFGLFSLIVLLLSVVCQ
jgi:hypothetical protein